MTRINRPHPIVAVTPVVGARVNIHPGPFSLLFSPEFE